MNWKTSTKLSVRFTLMAAFLVALFAGLVNVFFFFSWFKQERQSLRKPPPSLLLQESPRLGEKKRSERRQERLEEMLDRPGVKATIHEMFQRTVVVRKDDPRYAGLIENKRGEHFSVVEGRWFMLREDGERLFVTHVTHMVHRQMDLIRLSFYFLLLFVGVAFGCSLLFVKRALKDISELADHVGSLDVDNLHKRIDFSHLPKGDVIRSVADATDEMGKTIERQVKSIKRFVSHVSHEFKTPLMVMQSNHDLAMRSKKYREGLDKNLASIEHLNRLLDSLLLLTKVEGGQESMKKERLSLSSLVVGCVEEMKQKYGENERDIRLNLDSDVSVLAHRGSVERVLSNLLDNAYKYSAAGSVFFLSLSEDKVFTLEDHGIGMSQEELSFLREDFWQADSSKGLDSGFGLGLSLVKKLVDMHGWSIDVKSEKNVGTTFVLQF